MRRFGSEVIGSLFGLVIGIFFALSGIKFGLGTLSRPGPGFLPVIMAMFLIFFSLFNFIKDLFRPAKTISQIPWKRAVWVIASVFLYGLLLDLLGFLISTFIMMFILFGLLRGKSKWTHVFIYAAGTALAAWLVFSVALSVPFPSSRLMDIWR